MAFYPTSAAGLNYITYPVGPTVVPAANVTASASTNTKGSYTELTSSTTFDSNWAELFCVASVATAGVQYLLDIGTGAAGSEVSVINNVMLQGGSTTTRAGMGSFALPIQIASSTRVALRCQSSTGSSTLRIELTLWAAGSMGGCLSFTTYGAATGDSGGTSVDPGGTADTKGAYTQITASTTSVHQFLVVVTSNGGNAAPITATWAKDLATGAAGSEVVLVPDLRHGIAQAASAALINWAPLGQGFATYIASSTRLAVRASCSTNDATDRLFDVEILGGVSPTEAALLEAASLAGGLV